MSILSMFSRRTDTKGHKDHKEDLRRERAAAQRAAAEAKSRLLDELSKAVLNDLHRKPNS